MTHRQMTRMKQKQVASTITVKIWNVVSQEKWGISLFYISRSRSSGNVAKEIFAIKSHSLFLLA